MFPYIASVYVDYLTEKLTDARVVSDVPAKRPARLVAVSTAPAGSSAKPEVLSWRRLVFRIWDPDEYTAGTLAERVRWEVVLSRRAGIGVRRVNVIGEPAKLKDPDDGAVFFQVTADVLVRANR
ncbi:hypothetical protein DS6A_15 [Mycobacterium phage DS6A]|uniref:DUF3168 domain-containing protein n=1 Tax=Mycobacterium phage DS6A TaxID=45764 RepID=G8I4C5_9CAUD|nr:hypothetical protein DS6A_15 [Mycobacterium phage DS6A]AER47569.1 hypothetical protein DS6A_15 [Mycobacterium phage DS6A]